jgi:hypothetical protein
VNEWKLTEGSPLQSKEEQFDSPKPKRKGDLLVLNFGCKVSVNKNYILHLLSAWPFKVPNRYSIGPKERETQAPAFLSRNFIDHLPVIQPPQTTSSPVSSDLHI